MNRTASKDRLVDSCATLAIKNNWGGGHSGHLSGPVIILNAISVRDEQHFALNK